MPMVLCPTTDVSCSDCVRVTMTQEHRPLVIAGSLALTRLMVALEKAAGTKAMPKLALPTTYAKDSQWCVSSMGKLRNVSNMGCGS